MKENDYANSRVRLVLPMLTSPLVGCGAPPTAKRMRRVSRSPAPQGRARLRTPPDLSRRRKRPGPLHAELKTQEGKFISQHHRARELAVAAKTAAIRPLPMPRARASSRRRKRRERRRPPGATREARQGDSRRRSDSSANQDQEGRPALPGHRSVRSGTRRRRDRSDD